MKVVTDLFDNARLVVSDHWVVRALEGFHPGQLPIQNGLTHPELRRHKPDPLNPGREVVTVYQVVGDQGLAGDDHASDDGGDVSGGEEAGECGGQEL